MVVCVDESGHDRQAFCIYDSRSQRNPHSVLLSDRDNPSPSNQKCSMFDNFSSITVACNRDDSRPAKRKQTLALTSEERQIDCVRTRYSGLADSVDVDAVRPPITQCFIVQPYRKLGSAFADPYSGWIL